MRKALYAVLALALLTGCSGSGESDMYAKTEAGAPAPQAARDAPAALTDMVVPQSGAPEKTVPTDGVDVERAIAYKASLRVRVEKAEQVESAAARAKELVAAAGGYVAEETVRGTVPSARLRLQVPADEYPRVLADLSSGDLGEKISLEQSAEDVTEEVADVDSRLASAEAAIKRLRALLSRAGTVG
jgi:hypothetical protein